MFGAMSSIAAMAIAVPSLNSMAAGASSTLSGDYATVTDVKQVSMSTGTAPFDKDDAPGNDSSKTNSTIRSFDSATYTIQYVTTPRASSPSRYFSSAMVRLTATLALPKEQATFDMDSLAWASTRKGYEATLTESAQGGGTVQTIVAWRELEGTTQTPNVIPGVGTLSIPVLVRSMHQGQKVSPHVSVALEHNPDSDARGMDLDPMTVSSAPKYNVRLETDGDTGAGEWDFSVGDGTAQNKQAGKVEGRLYRYGIVLEMRNDTVEKGLRGMEAPDGSPISFDLSLQTVAMHDGKSSDATDKFAPLLWTAGAQDGADDHNGGRHVRSNGGTLAYLNNGTVPFNRFADPSWAAAGSWYRGAYVRDGGQWGVTQSGSALHATVSGYAVDPDVMPVRGASSVDVPSGSYGTGFGPNVLAFSAGFLTVVQPFRNAAGQVATDRYGSGEVSFALTMRDSALRATGASGTAIPTVSDASNQTLTSDDSKTRTQFMKVPGGWDTRVAYTYADNDTVRESGTDRADYTKDYSRGDDAAMVTGYVGVLWGQVRSAVGTPSNITVYQESLLKFDSSVLEYVPEQEGIPHSAMGVWRSGGVLGNDYMPADKVRLLFAVKEADGTGWRDDDEMKSTGMDSLVYYDTYEAWKASGKALVGLMTQTRWVTVDYGRQDFRTKVLFRAGRDAADIGKTPMVTIDARLWDEGSVADRAAAMAGKDAASLTRADYQAYADSVPSMASAAYRGYLPAQAVGDNRGPRYTKGYYDGDGNYAGGHTGGYTYGDTLLITGETVKVNVSTSQQSGGAAKRTYDLDYLQRHADWTVTPTMETADSAGAGVPTTLHLRVTVPKGLAYSPGSAYVGGNLRREDA